ncbi:MAG: hypothetical protein IPM79_02235 [Polyangiaceae bacterium]|jgi:DNA-binding beta-propeller fold protein YncE|nr:hypothetical protein [Polyangiaceae bacterium]
MKAAPISRLVTCALGAALAALGAGSCFTGSDGLLPPTESLYFPTGLVVSPGRTTLYVVNSDFDLQYNGGTVQALNLAEAGGQPGVRELARAVATAIADGQDPAEVCGELGSTPNTNVSLYPGPCEPIDVKPFVQAFATVGAFGAGVTLLSRDDGQPGARLFVTVRGDPSVTYFDVPDDRDPGQIVSPCEGDFCLECAAAGDDQRCGRSHRIGENIFTSQRGLLLPTEPISVASAVARGSDPLVIAHQTAATASLVVNTWPEGDDTTPFSATPSLEYLLEGLPEAPTVVTTIPPPALVASASLAYRPGFLVSHRAENVLSVLRYFDDANASPPRPFLTKSDDVTLTISGANNDSRGMAFDTTRRDACEAECPADDTLTACLEGCLAEKVGFYVVSREPPSLLIGELLTEATREGDALAGVKESLSLDESVPLPIGPSLVSVGKVVGPSGELETRVFVVCFDSRFVVVYDPMLRKVESMIRTGRGPFGIAFDTAVNDAGEAESFMYLTHFTDSYLSVIDLDTRRLSYATPIASFGPPVPPREEQ